MTTTLPFTASRRHFRNLSRAGFRYIRNLQDCRGHMPGAFHLLYCEFFSADRQLTNAIAKHHKQYNAHIVLPVLTHTDISTTSSKLST